MPAARKSKASSARSTAGSSSSRPSGTKSYPCLAWWCDSTFTRHADMMKHVGMEHFGKRHYCIICCAAMKQRSNLNTHLNKHFGIHCTLCSCGEGFTDPSTCTRHRTATGHAEGITFRKPRPVILEPIGVQHLAGLAVTVEMISDPSFIPPPFDLSYHRKGMSKPKAQEKFNSTDYLITDRARAPNIPSAQAAVFSPEDVVSTSKYQEPPTESPAVPQTNIQVEDLGFNVELSYDVELPQEPRYDQVPIINAYPGSPSDYPTYDSQTPPNDHYTPMMPIPHRYSHSAIIPHMPAGANPYPQPHSTNYATGISYHLPPPPWPFSGPHVPPEYLGRYQFRAPNNITGSLDMPPHHGFVEVGFGMHVPLQQLQYQHQQHHFYIHQPNVNFNHMYQPALAAL